MTLTDKETQMLKSFIQEGLACCGAETADDLINDNMTWMNADDLKEDLGWSKQAIGGVMASLSEKHLIQDSGDSPRGARVNDWYADDKAIRWFFAVYAAGEHPCQQEKQI